MELKLRKRYHIFSAPCSSNRTFMELKFKDLKKQYDLLAF